MLGKRETTTINIVEPKEGERTLLPSDESGQRSPSLDIDNKPSKEQLLNELADIFVESILWEINHGNESEKGSDLLPGVNQRTG